MLSPVYSFISVEPASVADLLALVPGGLTVTVRTNDVLRNASLVVFDRTFEVTAVLRNGGGTAPPAQPTVPGHPTNAAATNT